ncbi:glycosyltransferase family 4 protein, partial [Gemmatimonadota bacterium]
GVVGRVLRAIEHAVYRGSRRVFVISRSIEEKLLSRGVSPAKLSVIENWFSAGLLETVHRQNPFSAEHRLDHRFVVLFAGNIGFSQGLETLLVEAAEALKEESEVHFLVVGGGSGVPALRRAVEERGLSNTTLLEFQPKERVPEIYATADLCLVPLKKGFSEDSVPSKLLTIMASGRAVLASVEAGSETAKLVRESQCGLVVQPEDSAGLADAIMTLFRQRDSLAEMGRRGQQVVVGRYSKDGAVGRYAKALRGIAEEADGLGVSPSQVA